MKQISRILSFFMFPVSVLLVHSVLSQVLDLYTIYPNLDIPVHYMGGLAIAYTATRILSYLQSEKQIAMPNRAVLLILVVSLTATAAVFWEFAEFIGDQFLAINVQVSLANTMQDQFMGILGGATWAWLCYRQELMVQI